MYSSENKLDIVVFGATGFTGKYVVEELVRLQKSKSTPSFTFGVAGRSSSKLHGVLADAFVDHPDASKVPVIEADVNNSSSLLKMAQSAKILLNCVGPYRFFGESVVQACISAGTDYLDISGEPEFVEKMYLKYHQKAVEKNILIVSTCGFDSIPADMGVLYSLDQLDPDMKPTLIESYFELEGHGRTHYATYESAVHGLGSRGELSQIRKQINYPKLPVPRPPDSLPARMKYLPQWEPRLSKYSLPFAGSDAAVVRRTQLALCNQEGFKPTDYHAYMTIASLFNTILFVVFGTLFVILAKFSLGRSLLLKYPKIFSAGFVSHEGPTKQQIDSCYFKMTFFTTAYSSVAQNGPSSGGSASGRPEKMLLTTRVQGPEPGYVFTPIALTQAAMMVLSLRGSAKTKSASGTTLKPGVLTPGTAFYKTDYIKRLCDRGVKFTLLDKKRLPC